MRQCDDKLAVLEGMMHEISARLTRIERAMRVIPDPPRRPEQLRLLPHPDGLDDVKQRAQRIMEHEHFRGLHDKARSFASALARWHGVVSPAQLAFLRDVEDKLQRMEARRA